MNDKRSCVRVLRLFNVTEELKHIEDDEDIPSSIGNLPSENSNSDENSNDEIQIPLPNLPGYQLRSPATLSYRDDDVDQSSNNSKEDMLDSEQQAKSSHIFVRHANESWSFTIDNFPYENKDVDMVLKRYSPKGPGWVKLMSRINSSFYIISIVSLITNL